MKIVRIILGFIIWGVIIITRGYQDASNWFQDITTVGAIFAFEAWYEHHKLIKEIHKHIHKGEDNAYKSNVKR